MAKKLWHLQLEDGAHTVELDHRYFSGKKTILVDGEFLPLPASAQAFVDSGGDYAFRIGAHEGVVHIKTDGLLYYYSLSLDGRVIDEDPEAAARGRERTRTFMCGYCIVIGIICFGFPNWRLNGLIPLPYLGWFLIGLGVLGLLGLNIFRSGPLDRRND